MTRCKAPPPSSGRDSRRGLWPWHALRGAVGLRAWASRASAGSMRTSTAQITPSSPASPPAGRQLHRLGPRPHVPNDPDCVKSPSRGLLIRPHRVFTGYVSHAAFYRTPCCRRLFTQSEPFTTQADRRRPRLQGGRLPATSRTTWGRAPYRFRYSSQNAPRSCDGMASPVVQAEARVRMPVTRRPRPRSVPARRRWSSEGRP